MPRKQMWRMLKCPELQGCQPQEHVCSIFLLLARTDGSSAYSRCPSVQIHLLPSLPVTCWRGRSMLSVACQLSTEKWWTWKRTLGEFRAPSHWFWDTAYQLTATIGWEKNKQVLSFPLGDCVDGSTEMGQPWCNALMLSTLDVARRSLTCRTCLHLGFLLPSPINLHHHWQTLSDLYTTASFPVLELHLNGITEHVLVRAWLPSRSSFILLGVSSFILPPPMLGSILLYE